jgi:hypothetical protein
MSLLLRLVHIAFVRLNIQIFHFHHNQLSLLLPKHRKIWLIATTHRVNRLGLHLYYKTNSSFQLQRMMSTQQKWVPSVFYHIGTIVKKWKFPVIFPIVENAKNRIQIVVKYPTCRTCDWRSGTTNSLSCSFPWWICYKSLGGSFAPKCSWCLKCVNFRCHVQICSYTIQTAIPPNLLSCCLLVIRLPVIPHSISCEFALTINEGNDFYIIARAHGVNPICFYLPRFRIRDLHSCDFIAENLLCCRM